MSLLWGDFARQDVHEVLARERTAEVLRFHRRVPPEEPARPLERSRMSRAEHFLLGLTVGVWGMSLLYALMAWSAR